MTRTLSHLGAALLFAENPGLKLMRAVDEDMARFRQVAHAYHPAAAESYVRTVAEEIVRRAQFICKTSAADPAKVVPFLLEACRQLIHRGSRIEDIAAKLPRDLNSLGMFILEMNINPHTGGPLTDAEIRAANKQGKLKLQ